jgi:hypothetical protein
MFVDEEEVKTEVREWLRYQPKIFYAAGFDAPVKRWDKGISVRGVYVGKRMLIFFMVRTSRFTFCTHL